MLSKNEAKYIQSLSHKKQRQESGLFIAEGVKLVDELINSSLLIRKIYATDQWNRPVSENYDLVRVSEDELQKISLLQKANQVLAIVEEPQSEPLQVVENKWMIALDGIQDPGNMGTIIRIADWFGIDTIVASEDSVDAFNPKVVQSTMGSITRVKVYYMPVEGFLQSVKVPVYGALLKGQPVYGIQDARPGVLVIGNESKGIHTELLPLIDRPVNIPRIGEAESLNAAVATGILLSHLTGKGAAS
ncbi:MAG: RNA methyltransferase [Sediminibacterium sp.]|nr:RNA methyltransferase [Sediminibacterium sp.]